MKQVKKLSKLNNGTNIFCQTLTHPDWDDRLNPLLSQVDLRKKTLVLWCVSHKNNAQTKSIGDHAHTEEKEYNLLKKTPVSQKDNCLIKICHDSNFLYWNIQPSTAPPIVIMCPLILLIGWFPKERFKLDFGVGLFFMVFWSGFLRLLICLHYCKFISKI